MWGNQSCTSIWSAAYRLSIITTSSGFEGSPAARPSACTGRFRGKSQGKHRAMVSRACTTVQQNALPQTYKPCDIEASKHERFETGPAFSLHHDVAVQA